MSKTIAFLGIGAMGARMAKNLIEAGYDVRGYSPSEATRKAGSDLGISVVDSSAQAADGADVILSCVPATEHMLATYLGPQGAFETAAKGAVCFDFSTVTVEGSLHAAAEAEKRGVAFLDTPVSGSTPQAEAGALAVMVGGDAAKMNEHMDVLDVVGGSVTHMGDNGAGLKMKFVTNLILGIHITAIAEGINLGRLSGLDAAAMFEFLGKSSVPRLLAGRTKQISNREYPAGFTVELLLKDLALIGDAAAELNLALPLGTAAANQLIGATALGHAKNDMSSVSESYVQAAGGKPIRG